MLQPRITEFFVEGVRTLAKVRLRLGGLSVLIGENGSGKSTILEALELLRRATTPNFMQDFSAVHGGLFGLLRSGESRLAIGAKVARPDGGVLEYRLTLERVGQFPRIASEVLARDAIDTAVPRRDIFSRPNSAMRVHVQGADGSVSFFAASSEDSTVLSAAIPEGPAFDPVRDVRTALANIRVHCPFKLGAAWANQGLGFPSPLREPQTLEPATELRRFGVNLASAYQALRNEFGERHWAETLALIRMGLGESARDIKVRVDAGGGRVSLALEDARLPEPVYAFALADGVLAYLAHVALIRLGTEHSLIAFDEPEILLHPGLLARVVGLYESAATSRPIVLTTHSDRLLDSLGAPESSVVLCELDERQRTTLARPDAQRLARWREQFGGFYELRSGTHEAAVFAPKKA